MDSIAYIASNPFICVAVSKNLNIRAGSAESKIDNSKKVYKLNKNTIVSFVGHPQRNAAIYKYLSNIKSSTNTYDEIMDDLSFIFNHSNTSFQKSMDELGMLVRKYRNRDGGLNKDVFFNKIKDKPHLILIAKDLFNNIPSKIESPNVILIFSRESNKTVFGRYIFYGQNMAGAKIEIPYCNTYIGFNHIAKKTEETSSLENKISATFKSWITNNWEEDKYHVETLKQVTKEALIKGLTEMSPLVEEKDIIFYELSEKTNYEFSEPDVKLYSSIEEF